MKLCNPFSEQEEEVLRVELEKKYALFARQEKKGEEPTIMERTRANIKNLQNYIHNSWNCYLREFLFSLWTCLSEVEAM
jgi:hypothetical protein